VQLQLGLRQPAETLDLYEHGSEVTDKWTALARTDRRGDLSDQVSVS
jgi:hypothetical protein